MLILKQNHVDICFESLIFEKFLFLLPKLKRLTHARFFRIIYNKECFINQGYNMDSIHIKNKIRNLLHKLGKIDILPAEVVNGIKIVETHDPMVDVKDDDAFFFSSDLQKENHVYLRKSVYEKLKNITFPEGYYIKIMSAYRSLDDQKKRWNEKYNTLKKKYPEIKERELIQKVKSVCADPKLGFGGHQTGGAIDITLCDKHGNDYDMGTSYRSLLKQSRTDSKDLNDEQANNRRILVEALRQLDFVNYPLEWWHHSYGDRLWAAYKHYNQCMFGMPDDKEFANVRENEANEISITFSVPQGENSYKGGLVLNELQGADTRSLAKIACDMAWNDTLQILLKSDAEKSDYEKFIQEKAPDLIDRWTQIMSHRPKIIAKASEVTGKPFEEMTSEDKSNLYSKIDKSLIPLKDWHINFSQLSPDLAKQYKVPEDAFFAPAKEYIEGAKKRQKGNDKGNREGFWLAIRDEQSNKLLGVMAFSTKIIRNNLIGHSARFISPDYQRQKIAGTAGFVALDFMYKYLVDVRSPDLYKGENPPLFATTCHPFNSASRGLQGHNGAKFKQYNPTSHKFEYTTERSVHENKINGAERISWNATYQGLSISSKTGTDNKLCKTNKGIPNRLHKEYVDRTMKLGYLL